MHKALEVIQAEFSAAAVVRPTIAPGAEAVDLTRLVSTQLKADVLEQLATGAAMIVVDVRNVTYVESFALGILVHVAKLCRERSVAFCVLGLRGDLQELFRLTRLDTLMHVITETEWQLAGGDASVRAAR